MGEQNEKGVTMTGQNWIVPLEKLIGRTATEAQAIVDSRRGELGLACNSTAQDRAVAPALVRTVHDSDSNFSDQTSGQGRRALRSR
jgi:hypothetical protein